jgi:outer membrane protein OmpA-like peptidoglycan-associated protein
MGKKYAGIPIIVVLLVFILSSAYPSLAASDSNEVRLKVPTKFGLSGLYTLFDAETPNPLDFSVGVYFDHSRFEQKEDPRDPQFTEVRFGAAVGILPRFQLGVSIPATDVFLPAEDILPEFTDSGIGDITLSGKYRLVDETAGAPTVAVYSQVSFPTGDEEIGLGSGTTDFTVGGIVTKRIGSVNLYGNVGYLFSGYEAGDPNPLLRSFQDSLAYGVGADFSVAKGETPVNIFAEATFFHEFGDEAEDTVVNFAGIPVEDDINNPGQLNIGVHLGLGESFALTGGGGFKILGERAVAEAPTWRVFGGVTYSFMKEAEVKTTEPRTIEPQVTAPQTTGPRTIPPTQTTPPTRVIPVQPTLINRCPEITDVVLNTVETVGKGQVTIFADVIDTDNDTLTYQWSATGGEILGSGNRVIWTAPDCETVGTSSANYEITVTVSDGKCPVSQMRTITVKCDRMMGVKPPSGKEEKPPSGKKEEKAPFSKEEAQRIREGKVPFDKGSARLNNIAKAALDNIATVLKKLPDQNILLEGHTDATSNKTVDRQIALRRAQSVKNYLVQRHGIEAKRISVKSYGSARSIAPNNTEGNRKQNRRVEVYRLGK